jgi:hypothetical protein
MPVPASTTDLMTGDFLLVLLLFPATLILPGFLFARRLRAEPLERLLAAVLFSCIGAYLVAFALYLLKVPAIWFDLWAVAGLAAVVLLRREWRAFGRDADVRACLGPWAVVTTWILGALALIHHYSGGAWSSDWIEHYQRTLFFLDRWPLNFKFLTFYALPARPPLANLVVGGLMALTGRNYACFQLGNTLFNTLAFLPAVALLRHCTKSRAAPWLLALVWMLNPMMLQNATFAWTKQSTAFFVLTGVWFFLRGRQTGAAWRDHLAFLAVGTGALCHYSAGPYLVATALLYMVLERRNLARVAGWRRMAVVAAGGVAMLATWLVWSLWRFGWHGTLLSNTTAIDFVGAGAWLRGFFGNVLVTLVPQSPWRLDDAIIFSGTDPIGTARDYYFMIYQTNLLWGVGSGAWLAVLWLAAQLWREHDPARGAGLSPSAWTAWVLVVFLLGTASHPPDAWGVAHVTLQPLVMLGLVLLAARADRLPLLLRRVLVCTALVDFLLGSVLHQAIQHRDYTTLWLRGQRYAQLAADQNTTMRMSIQYKLLHDVDFWGDQIHPPAALMVGLLALLLLLVGVKWWQARRADAAIAAG